MTESLVLRGTLSAHDNWVTCLATTIEQSDVLLSGSRDKTIIAWTLDGGENYGTPRKSLRGHSHYVQDVTISSDGQFALSGSWDGSLRLWDLNTGTTTRRFVGHTKDVLSVAFSVDTMSTSGRRPSSSPSARDLHQNPEMVRSGRALAAGNCAPYPCRSRS